MKKENAENINEKKLSVISAINGVMKIIGKRRSKAISSKAIVAYHQPMAWLKA
jgi:hypothetical protein